MFISLPIYLLTYRPVNIENFQRCHNIHHSDIERLRVVIPANIDTHATPVADHFEYIWRIDVNTRILSIPENFENFEYIWCIDVNVRILSVPENFENFHRCHNTITTGIDSSTSEYPTQSARKLLSTSLPYNKNYIS